MNLTCCAPGYVACASLSDSSGIVKTKGKEKQDGCDLALKGVELPFPPQPPCIFHNLCTYITILGPGTGYTGYLNKVWQLKNLFKTVTLPSWNVYMLWFNFILGLNFISICFKLIIIHYQTPKQRELNFKPRKNMTHNKYLLLIIKCGLFFPQKAQLGLFSSSPTPSKL